MTTKKKIHTYCKYKQLKTRERILFSDSEVHVHVNMIKNKILKQGQCFRGGKISTLSYLHSQVKVAGIILSHELG